MKEKPSDIHPRNKCAKFQSNPTIFGLCRLPQRFWPILGKNGSRGPKNENFQKMKKNPGIHPKNNCTKFQPNPTSFGLCRLPLRFWRILGKNRSRGPENENFQKIKNHPQVFTQGTSVPNFS